MTEQKWWEKAVFYQIYPRSFADGNGDGIGDFIGMTQKLDHLAELGIDAVWLSPHFPSPQFDVGYDISDYTDVAPEYGNLADFKAFLDGAHARGIKVILDLVANHTSHLHQWFLESRCSRDNLKRDWYMWRDGVNGGPPNNWMSPFGGSAWEYDEATDQYYYHFFLREQPDLNWRNPAVKEAMWDAVRFWLKMGVDGYRLDAIGTIYEDPEMPNHTATMTQEDMRRGLQHGFPYDQDSPLMTQWLRMYENQEGRAEVHPLMKELRKVVDEFPDRMLVGESEEIAYYGNGSDELHLAFNFPLMKTPRLTPKWIRDNQAERLKALGDDKWPCNTLNNHDASRSRSRYSDGKHEVEIAKTSLALMMTLRGTPFFYYGEEIGMTNFRVKSVEELRDPPAVWFYENEIGDGTPHEKAMVMTADYSRDRCRTPMQWNKSANAGFSPSGARTWLPVNPNYLDGINVEEQRADPGSMLNYFKALVALRKRTPALVDGSYTALNETSEEYYAFVRKSPSGQAVLVVLNLSEKPQTASFDLPAYSGATLLFSTHQAAGTKAALGGLSFAPFEVYIAELAPKA